jgi:hypothetical protein
MNSAVTHITARLNGDDGPVKRFKGRAAWALDRLLAAGQIGCTPIDQPAPRWSHYVFLLRRDGVDIETVHENHGGAYAGHHARYLLRTPVEIIERQEAA